MRLARFKCFRRAWIFKPWRIFEECQMLNFWKQGKLGD
jgi:hypothetical protein